MQGTDAELGWLSGVLRGSRPGMPPVDLESAMREFPGTWEDFAESWAWRGSSDY